MKIITPISGSDSAVPELTDARVFDVISMRKLVIDCAILVFKRP